jgi:hypothetical protein
MDLFLPYFGGNPIPPQVDNLSTQVPEIPVTMEPPPSHTPTAPGRQFSVSTDAPPKRVPSLHHCIRSDGGLDLADHPALAPAVELAGIATSRSMAAAKFVCTQSARMMERARGGTNLRGKREQEKRDAAEVMLTFTAPSPARKAGNPSRRDRACALGIAASTLDCVDKHMIKKRRLLSAGEMGIHWALAKKKKGYTTISDDLKLLLVKAFNNHPHVIVSPNSKERLQMINAEGEKIFVQKIMTMVGIGTIFLKLSENTLQSKILLERGRSAISSEDLVV